MKQINTNMCKWGHEMEMFYDRIWVFLSLTGIWREGIGTKTVPKLLPHSDYAKDSLWGIAVFENSILGIPTWLYSPQSVLETGCRSFCSYSGVSSLQFLRTSAGCYNLLWQISVRCSFIDRDHIPLPTQPPAPARSPQDPPTGMCLYFRLFFPQAVRRGLFYVKFSTVS